MNDEKKNTPRIVSGICARHEALARDIGSLIQATADLRDRLSDHRRDLAQDIETINRTIRNLIKANGLKGERIASVEAKVSWLGGVCGIVGGALVNFVLWVLRGR